LQTPYREGRATVNPDPTPVLADRLRSIAPEWSETEVTTLNDLASGWESLLSVAHLRFAPVEKVVLRRYPGRDGRGKSQREAAGMHALHAMGYPVPEVYAAEPDASVLGMPFSVIEYISGDTLPMNDAAGLSALLSRLHELDASPVAAALGDRIPHGHDGSRGLLTTWRAFMESFPGTGLDPVFDWLEIHLDAAPVVPTTVTHLDFHPMNVLVHPERGPTVIDWTQVGVGDPRHDVAWTAMLATAYLDEEAARAFVAAYRARRGPLEGQVWFDVAAYAKRLFSVVVSIVTGPDVMGMNPESAVTIAQDPSHAVVYERLVDETGIVVPEIESALGLR
jgi:aminoglycoside phosphotransferase (APT) family kinase protein